MGHWAIYVADPPKLSELIGAGMEAGSLVEVVSAPPDVGRLREAGLATAFFGEDAPDTECLMWCPRRLTFVGREVETVSSGATGAMERRLSALQRRVAALDDLAGSLFQAKERLSHVEGEIAGAKRALAALLECARVLEMRALALEQRPLSLWERVKRARAEKRSRPAEERAGPDDRTRPAPPGRGL